MILLLEKTTICVAWRSSWTWSTLSNFARETMAKEWTVQRRLRVPRGNAENAPSGLIRLALCVRVVVERG